jgi:hypothetical protein
MPRSHRSSPIPFSSLPYCIASNSILLHKLQKNLSGQLSGYASIKQKHFLLSHTMDDNYAYINIMHLDMSLKV